jgi:hypothetical protein
MPTDEELVSHFAKQYAAATQQTRTSLTEEERRAEIARRAYEIWQERGGTDSGPEECHAHWLEAEQGFGNP